MLAATLVARGVVAQLGERELCKLEVVGSIPIGSTSSGQLLAISARAPLER